jgi:Cysteine-rich CPCC
MYPERFDHSTLTTEDNNLLSEFATRRSLIGRYLRQLKLHRFTCPSCAFPTLLHQGILECCAVCDWKDDGQDDEDANDILGGPNGKLSLTEYRVASGYSLRALVHELKGHLLTDPLEILAVIQQHEDRMDHFQEEHSMNVDDDHPVWEAWKKEKAKLRFDLIKRTILLH